MQDPKVNEKPVEKETLKARITGISGGFIKRKPKSMWDVVIDWLGTEEPPPQLLVSTTRPRTLPPKTVDEEKEHLAEYERMMKKFKVREEEESQQKEKKKQAQIRREQMMMINTQKWEKEILPDWDNRKNLPETKELWWEGLPPRVRGVVWATAVGNRLGLTPAMFKEYLRKAEKLKMIVNLEEASKREQYMKLWGTRKNSKTIQPVGFKANPSPDTGAIETDTTPTEAPDSQSLGGVVSPDSESGLEGSEQANVSPSTPTETTETITSPHQTEPTTSQPPAENDEVIPSQAELEPAEVPPQPEIRQGEEVKEPTDLANYSREAAEIEKEFVPTAKEKTVSLISLDLPRTFPVLAFFQPGGPCHHQLRQVLEAYVCHRPDLGYVQGMSFIAAALLLNMDEYEAWVCICNLLDEEIMTIFYTMDVDQLQVYLDTFSTLMAEILPQLQRHLETRLGVDPHVYFFDWILTLYTKSIPIESAARIFDLFVLEGESFLFRAALGILSYLQPKLLAADFDEAMHILQQITSVDDQKLFNAIAHIDLPEKKYFTTLAKFKNPKQPATQ